MSKDKPKRDGRKGPKKEDIPSPKNYKEGSFSPIPLIPYPPGLYTLKETRTLRKEAQDGEIIGQVYPPTIVMILPGDCQLFKREGRDYIWQKVIIGETTGWIGNAILSPLKV